MSETRCTCGNGCETFGQCMRRKHIRVGQVDASEQRRWDSRLNKFHDADDEAAVLLVLAELSPAGEATRL